MLIEDLTSPNYDLKGRYDEFNRLYFDNQLPAIPLAFKPLKGVGGVVNGTVIYSGKKTHPALVRLGHSPYEKAELKMETLKLTLSSAYLRSPEQIDPILLHEMIHVWEFAVAKAFGQNHGRVFLDKRKEVIERSGIKVPLTDKIEGVLVNPASKSVGVLLRKAGKEKSAYAIVTEKLATGSLDAIRDRYYDLTAVYTTSSAKWIEKAQGQKVQRAIGPNTKFFYVTDETLIDDLKETGKAVWTRDANQ